MGHGRLTPDLVAEPLFPGAARAGVRTALAVPAQRDDSPYQGRREGDARIEF